MRNLVGRSKTGWMQQNVTVRVRGRNKTWRRSVVGREACVFTGISRSFQVLSRFSRQARVNGSRFVAFHHGASRHVTVYGPGSILRVAFYYGLTLRARSGREYIKTGPGRGTSFESEQSTTHYCNFMGIILEARVSLIFSLLCILFKNVFQVLAIFKPYCGGRDLHRESTKCKWVCEINRGIHCKSGTSFMGLAVNAGISISNEERQNTTTTWGCGGWRRRTC